MTEANIVFELISETMFLMARDSFHTQSMENIASSSREKSRCGQRDERDACQVMRVQV